MILDGARPTTGYYETMFLVLSKAFHDYAFSDGVFSSLLVGGQRRIEI